MLMVIKHQIYLITPTFCHHGSVKLNFPRAVSPSQPPTMFLLTAGENAEFINRLVSVDLARIEDD